MQNLKSKYEKQEMMVSESLWERLDEKLNQAPEKEQKPKIFWLKYAAVVFLMISLGGSFLMFNNKSEMKKNKEFANQSRNSVPIEQSENNEVEELNPIKNNSETHHQKLAVKDLNNPSTPLRMTNSVNKEKPVSHQIPEKELNIKEPQIVSKLEEQLAQNDAFNSTNTQKSKERPKYISSSDLLFGAEIDKAKSEMPKSAMGINTIKPKNDNTDFPNPKRIKLFGITLYDKDSITTK